MQKWQALSDASEKQELAIRLADRLRPMKLKKTDKLFSYLLRLQECLEFAP